MDPHDADHAMNDVRRTVTAGAYVCIDSVMPFMVGPTADGKRLAVVRLGGHCEPRETPWECAAREAKEEASVAITEITPPATFWLRSSDDPRTMQQRPCRSTTDGGVPPMLVVDDHRTTPGRRSLMYLARAHSAPVPSHEAMGLLLLTADDVQGIVCGGMSLGDFLDAGGQAVFRSTLSRTLILEPFLQLRVLAHLLVHFPEIRKAMEV